MHEQLKNDNTGTKSFGYMPCDPLKPYIANYWGTAGVSQEKTNSELLPACQHTSHSRYLLWMLSLILTTQLVL